jgi:hypothetical protein
VDAMFGDHPWTVQEWSTASHEGPSGYRTSGRAFVWSSSKVRDLIESI